MRHGSVLEFGVYQHFLLYTPPPRSHDTLTGTGLSILVLRRRGAIASSSRDSLSDSHTVHLTQVLSHPY